MCGHFRARVDELLRKPAKPQQGGKQDPVQRAARHGLHRSRTLHDEQRNGSRTGDAERHVVVGAKHEGAQPFINGNG
jgi:hypothetical protein